MAAASSSRHDARHEDIVARRDDEGRQLEVRQARPRIEGEQGSDARMQIVDALEAGQAMRLFLRHAGFVPRQPVGGKEEDRLRAHVGRRSFVLEQRQADVEAATGVAVDGRPAVDDGERAQALGPALRQGETHEAAQRVADEVGRGRLAGIEHRRRFVGHGGDAVVGRQLAARAAGAGLVVGDDAIAPAQRLELRRPVAGGTTQSRREQHGLGVGAGTVVDVEDRLRHLPIWAIVAISTNASFFTSPHWMQ